MNNGSQSIPSRADPEEIAPFPLITRRAITGWVLYDLANTIFSMGVISLFFPLWARDVAGAERADALAGIATAISMGIIFVASPILGAMTDHTRRRMPFLVASTLVCVFATMFLARTGVYLTIIFFMIANIAYQAGLQFYDALLADVSSDENRGRISGLGVGVGYLGSFVAVALGLVFGNEDKAFLFLVIALTFLLFSIPCFFFVKERGNPHPRQINFAMITESTKETVRTLRSGHEYPGLRRFLFGRVFYTDAINTVILYMGLYTVNLAVSSAKMSEAEGQQQANLILMSAITFAVAGGFVWGWLTDKLGPKRTLDLVLQAWIGIFLAAAMIGLLGLPLWTLYATAACAGFALGGIWAADRPLMLRLTPPHRIGEFYGLYGMVGRFSSITGPVIWSIVTYLTIQHFGLAPHVGQGIAVLTLLVLMIASYIILRPVSDEQSGKRRDEKTMPGEPEARAPNIALPQSPDA